ncbi:hypothetical protein QBC41DRAFT_260162, partial [Cercophora samala]
MTNGWVQGNQERRFLQPDHFGDQDVYCEANHEPEDVLYIGSDDDEYESPAERRERIEAQARRYLQGKRLHLISASLSGPFTKASGWTNPWRSKSGVRKPSKRKRPTITKKPAVKIPPPAPYESSELSSPRSDIVHLDDAPTQDADDESLARVQDWRDQVLAEIHINATPTHHYPSQTEPVITPSKPSLPNILNDDASSELSPPPESPLIVTPIRPKKNIVLKDSGVRKEELPPQSGVQKPGAGQAMLLPVIDLSPHAIRLFEESYFSRESNKGSPVRQPLQGSPLKTCTPAPKLVVQQALEGPSTTETPADVGSAVTATERLPRSTQIDGSFRFRKTRPKQQSLPLRKSSRLSSVVPSAEDLPKERNHPDEEPPEIQLADIQTVEPTQEDQDTPQATTSAFSDNPQAVDPPEPELRIGTQDEFQLESNAENTEQGAVTSSQSTASQIDGVTLVPPSSAEEDGEDVCMDNLSCEKEPAPQDITAILGFPKRLLWPKPDLKATRQSSALTLPLDSAPVPTLFKAKEPAMPELEQAVVVEQPVSEIAQNANASVLAQDANDAADVVKCGAVENEEAAEAGETEEVETEEVTLHNMALKPEPEEDAPQPPRQPIMLVSAILEPEPTEPQLSNSEALAPQVLEPTILAPTPAPQPKSAPMSVVVSAPAPEPVPEPRTVTSPGSLAPVVNNLMAEIAHRASQGLNAIRRVLDQGTQSSEITENAPASDMAEAAPTDVEPVIMDERLADAATNSILDDKIASLPSPEVVTPEMVLDHSENIVEKTQGALNPPTAIQNEGPAERETVSEADEMDIDTESVANPEMVQEVTETAHQSESTSVSSHRSPSPAPVEQSPWAKDTASLPLAANIETPGPGRVAVLAAPDSRQSPISQSPWAKGDSQLQVIIPPAPEIRSFVPFSSPANSAVLQRPETPPPQIIPFDTNNSQASIAQLSTPESNKTAQRTPENNSFGLSTKSFRDFMTPSPQPAKRRKISGISSARNSAGLMSSTQLLFDAATANPWTPGLLSSSRRPTPSTMKPKSLLRQTLSSTTPSNLRKRKRVTFAPLPGELTPLRSASPPPLASDPASPYFSAEYPVTTPTATITVSTPATPVLPVEKIRPSSPPPSSLSAELPTAETEKFAKHFAKVATKRLGHTNFANPVAKLRQQKRLLPSSSQQVCDSPGVEAMAERFAFADSYSHHQNNSPLSGRKGGEEEEEELLQSQLDSQLGIVIEDGEEHTQEESQDVVEDVLQNLDDFLGVGGGLWDVDVAVKDMAREQKEEEEERRRRQQQQEEELRRLEMGLGGSVWE